MPTRFQQLRQAIANLAAPAAEQQAHLESIFPSHGSPLPSGFNADELGLEFGDIYCAAEDMLEYGEITREEIEAARPLSELLKSWSGKPSENFWTVAALFDDVRWEEVRQLAGKVLVLYPNELRESEYTKQI